MLYCLFFYFFCLFVDLIFCAATLKEGVDLLCSSYAGVGVGLGCLCAHLLRSGEIASLKLCKLGIGIGLDVGNEAQVGTLGHELYELGLVDDLLTRRVDEYAALLKLVDKGIVDALLGLGCGRDVERHDVTLLKQLLLRVDSMNASLLYGSLEAEGNLGIDHHHKALG